MELYPLPLEQLQKKINYSFRDIRYLQDAMTHSSFAHEMNSRNISEPVAYNERLEFLGDSVLSIVVSEYLFTHFSDYPEGELTKMRADVVCERALSKYADVIGLGQYLRLGHGEEKNGGRTRRSILADAFEAMLAAMYLDSGMNKSVIADFLMPFVLAEIDDAKAGGHAGDYKTALQQLIQQNGADILEYLTVGESGPDHSKIFDVEAKRLSDAVTVYMVPMVDPDGVDLVTGAISEGEGQYEIARRMAADYPQIPFPDGWKANLLGVDLNLQYPAGWLQAREIKFSQGYTRPGPRDYVGRAPLSQRESRALAGYTQYIDPDLVLAYHTQGKEIYWQFDDIEIEGARKLGERLAAVSGYTLTEPAEVSSFAGYKDWFIKVFRRPGFTIEAGSGENPLPIGQFDEIYRDNLGILVTAAMG